MKSYFRIVFLTLCFYSYLPSAQSAQSSPTINAFFSPHAGATESIVKLIGEAKHSIRVAAYSFTSKDIAQALLGSHKKGIDVEVVLDKSNATEKYSAADFLANSGIPTRINYKYAIMHDKFIVIDGNAVETGSFNYTNAAEKNNAENLIIIHDNGALAEKYQKNWQKLWNEGRDYNKLR